VIDLGSGGGGTYPRSRAGRWPGEDESGGGIEGARIPPDRVWLLPFLLLCLRERDLHGYELVYEIGGLGFVAVRPREIYAILREAEGEGLVFSERGEDGCMLSRRRYGLTEAGEAYLEFLSNSLQAYRREIEIFFKAYGMHLVPEVRG